MAHTRRFAGAKIYLGANTLSIQDYIDLQMEASFLMPIEAKMSGLVNPK